MKKIYYLIFFLALLFSGKVEAQSLTWDWATQTVGRSNSHGIATDKFGNTYVAGEFMWATDIGGITVSSAGMEDGFLVKYDATGNLKWLKIYRNPRRAIARSVGVDSLGNAYVIGDFQDSVEIGGQVYYDSIATSEQEGMFVIKYDHAGVQQWVKTAKSERVGSYGPGVTANKIAVSAAGTVFIIGDFNWSMDIEGNSRRANLLMYIQPFIASYNTNGQFQWVKFPDGDNSISRGQAIATDQYENCYITGGAWMATFNQTFIDHNQGHSFIAKLDKQGNTVWAVGAGTGARTRSNAIAVDSAGTVYIGGWFETPTTIAGASFTPGGGQDGFVAAYDSTGTGLWAKAIAGAASETVADLELAPDGGVLAAGHFQGTAAFGANKSKTASGARDAFVAHYTESGILTLAETLTGANSNDFCTGISLNDDGIMLTGQFSGNLDFGVNNTLTGTNSMYLARSGTLITANKKELSQFYKVYPNPAQDQLYIVSSEVFKDAHLTLQNITGQVVKQQPLSVEGETVLSLKKLPTGMYLLSIRAEGRHMVSKIIKE